jgi:hypothetical protein
MARVITRSAYAASQGVTPATVTRWVTRGRLTAPAVRADGMIDADYADEQLARELDYGKSEPLRGSRATRLTADPAETGGDPAASRMLLRARALSASVDAERKRRELEQERGKYSLTADIEATWRRQLSGFLLAIEQSFPDLADELAGLSAAAQRVVLRKWWREQRARAARDMLTAGEQMPDYTPDRAA